MMSDDTDFREHGRGFALGMRRDAEGRGSLQNFLALKDPQVSRDVISAGMAIYRAQGATIEDIAEFEAGFSDVLNATRVGTCP